MGLWIPFTLFAAFMQAWRNAFQHRLSQDISTAGVTLARFLWASPLAALYLWLLYHYWPAAEAPSLPAFSARFWGLVALVAVMQIVATGLMVVLFRMRNYAIGVGLAKSEAVIAAVLGAWFFHAPLTALAWAGVVVGAVAVWLLSSPGKLRGNLSLLTVATGFGCGLAFALATLWVREASLVLGLAFPFGAAWVLLLVIFLQTLLLLGWILWREPQTLLALWRRPRMVMATSVFSCLGSIGWFSAMSLETVALVKTLGQVEVLFTLLISARWFREALGWQTRLGLILIVAGAAAVMLA